MRLPWRSGGPSPWEFFSDAPRILPYLRPYRHLVAMSFGMVAIGSLMSLLAPWPLAIMIDSVLGDKPLPAPLHELEGLGTYQLLALTVIAGLLITGAQHGLAVVDNYVNTKLDQSLVLDLRSDLFRHVQRLSLAFHDRTRTGQMMFEINNQASGIGAIVVAIPPLLQSIITVAGMFVILLRLEPTLALLSLGVVPPIYFSAGYYARRIQPRVVEVRHLESRSMQIVHEAISMMRVIVAFCREGHEYRKFRSQAEEAVAARVDVTVRQTMFSLVVTMITAIGSSLVLGFGAYLVLQKRLTAGELLVVIGYVAALYSPLEQISNTVSGLQQQFITFRSTLRVLDTEPEIHERPDARRLTSCRGHVAFEGVSFSYAERHGTLCDVSFDAPPGTRVAIVGPTGAGKSTLLSLIARFYDPQQGRVTLDGHDLRDLTLATVRERISMVLQEPLLFSDTLEANILYGRMDASHEEVIDAARAANAHDFITELKHGYATMIGERGARLSGGERQRLSVARAFLKDAPILILDEPTSSIDSKTESVILDALQRLMEGRTTFMVAHRLSTILHADLILVMNHGRIVEHGSHEHLMAAGGLYAQLHEAQHGAARRGATAAVSSDGLAELTSAIVERGGSLSGPALAEMARAMALREGADQDPAWRLLAAAWPLMSDGETDPLRSLATMNGAGGEAARLARRLLDDLGIAAEGRAA
ncbi:MAG TPA: ABC transporter ATP-binding protein [Gaiellales bacterium]|nr:ABC transporter ATP-binding protein [Gaiellales bacterium]